MTVLLVVCGVVVYLLVGWVCVVVLMFFKNPLVWYVGPTYERVDELGFMICWLAWPLMVPIVALIGLGMLAAHLASRTAERIHKRT